MRLKTSLSRSGKVYMDTTSVDSCRLVESPARYIDKTKLFLVQDWRIGPEVKLAWQPQAQL